MACKNHPDRESVAACVACGAELCAECDNFGSDGKSYCSEDLPTQAGAPPAAVAAAVAPPVATTPQPVAPAPAAPTAVAAPPPAAAAGSGNMTLAAIGYVIWICALIAMLLEKEDRQVKYHAWNGLFWGIAMMIVNIAVRIVGAALREAPGGGMVAGALGLAPLAMFVFSIIFLIKALKREDVNIPVVSDMARKQVGM